MRQQRQLQDGGHLPYTAVSHIDVRRAGVTNTGTGGRAGHPPVPCIVSARCAPQPRKRLPAGSMCPVLASNRGDPERRRSVPGTQPTRLWVVTHVRTTAPARGTRQVPFDNRGTRLCAPCSSGCRQEAHTNWTSSSVSTANSNSGLTTRPHRPQISTAGILASGIRLSVQRLRPHQQQQALSVRGSPQGQYSQRCRCYGRPYQTHAPSCRVGGWRYTAVTKVTASAASNCCRTGAASWVTTTTACTPQCRSDRRTSAAACEAVGADPPTSGLTERR